MNTTVADELVARYLAQLQTALRDLPPGRREELLDEVSEHIAAARAELGPQPTEAQIRTLLERVGDPAAIAAEASPAQVDGSVPSPGWREVATLILLPIGGIIVPLLGWFVGVALLWTSEHWSVRSKLIGTLVVPGGLALPLSLALFPVFTEGCTSSPEPTTGGEASGTVCTGGTPGWLEIVGPVVGVLLVAAPIATVIYLGLQLRRQQPNASPANA